MPTTSKELDTLNHALADSGLRSTSKRELVYKIVSRAKDHPTADDVFARCRQEMPTFSLATVYNCLETLIKCNLIRQVNFVRQTTRYEPNLKPHAHFYCNDSGKVEDVDLPDPVLEKLKELLPESYSVSNIELNFRGTSQSETKQSAAITTL